MPEALQFLLSHPQYRRNFAKFLLKIVEVDASGLTSL